MKQHVGHNNLLWCYPPTVTLCINHWFLPLRSFLPPERKTGAVETLTDIYKWLLSKELLHHRHRLPKAWLHRRTLGHSRHGSHRVVAIVGAEIYGMAEGKQEEDRREEGKQEEDRKEEAMGQ